MKSNMPAQAVLLSLPLVGALAALAAPAAAATSAYARSDEEPRTRAAQVEHIRIHGRHLEGNLEGEQVDRQAYVVLPPSYATNNTKRYPVVYALHGYSVSADAWITDTHVPVLLESAIEKGAAEMIVVLPDSLTLYGGSMYSSSVTTGDFENYVAQDVVTYVDAHYRTIPQRTARGLVGHSMGGYGASRIGMRHPEVFGALYIMSPCCLSARPAGPSDAAAQQTLRDVKTRDDLAKLPFLLRANLATAAAWSPNPHNPPFYADLPFGDKTQDVLNRWAANAPLAFVDQYIGNLRQYRAITIDVGDRDVLKVDAGRLHDILDGYGLANTFEIYPGDHVSGVSDRFENHVLPFFSQNLDSADRRK